ncbi:transglycosylase SLT domain-containing protein [Bradymonas sediminis]|uniref:Uncharacterized protein n=1 Tax=Bradymonas sediminis TaxID=1548548 RepID=A0A2Z4FKM2_9DELT|nr:transglycosylase SLT domain-containing protein [Bradymonas sediminis]AWV89547.1 hypothetical protein DN745_09445 [Bradymonas sediminis]TDP76721.1 transglycosylase-like protein with SLT domain [Bradymonas sediminis]
MKFIKILLRIAKGIYDILASYLLGWVLVFALFSLGLHLGLESVARLQNYDSADALWRALSYAYGERAILWMRLLVFGALNAGLVYLFRRPLRATQHFIESGIDTLIEFFQHFSQNRPRARTLGHLVFSATVTSLLIPFVLQPTLVADYRNRGAWLERGANLVDGSASRYVADSVIGLYRKFYASPVESVGGVSDSEVASAGDPQDGRPPSSTPHGSTHYPPTPASAQPLMDRWDPIIWRAAKNDPERFAMLKAFMWVESAGRQFAVSTTGCSGLMQFCAGTARARPFREIFGVGQITTCKCDGPCRIDKQTRQSLETGAINASEAGDAFPCDPADARFNPERSIFAGAAYVAQLSERFGGNIYLMYIGYNSGPAVASRVYQRLGRRADASLSDIELHLAAAMRPYYANASARRARSLLRTHLPKINRAYLGYQNQTPAPAPVAMR